MSEALYATDRTRRFRQNELNKLNQKTIQNIEEFGCEVVQVFATCPHDSGYSFSYTIGVYDTCGRPELIEIGLPQSTGHALLNEAANRLRRGIDLVHGRHAELIANVECEFRPVDPKWVKHLMRGAEWYYERTAYPALQAVYPDLENRFPEEPGFDPSFAQPLLQPDAPFTKKEQDLWNFADGSDRFRDWRFPDPPHTRVFLSEAVDSGREGIVYVTRDMDGDWQFLGDSMSDGGGPVVRCLHDPIDRDNSLAEVADLPHGWCAERAAPGEPWDKYPRDSSNHEST